MTRSPSIAACLLGSGFLMMTLAGCSSTSMGRPKVLPGVRTTALVGDKPVAVVAGLPGESIEIDTRFPGRRARPREQISGRVVDASGRPVPNAQIRLSDASGLDARDLATETDEAGGFTIHNLRPGVRYHLAAQTRDGSTDLTGEEMAEAPQTNVRIALSSPVTVSQDDHPRRVDKISDSENRIGSNEQDRVPRSSTPRTRLAREEVDALPPPREAEALTSSRNSPAAAAPKAGDIWKSAETDTPEIVSGSFSLTELPAPSADRSAFGLPVEPESGPDPLPPAIDRGEAFQIAPSREAIAESAVPSAGQFDLSPDPGVESTRPPVSDQTPSTAPPSPGSSGSPSEAFIAAPSTSTDSFPPPIETAPSQPVSPAPIETAPSQPVEESVPAAEPPAASEPKSVGTDPEPPALESLAESSPAAPPLSSSGVAPTSGSEDSTAPLPSLESPFSDPALSEPKDASTPVQPSGPTDGTSPEPSPTLEVPAPVAEKPVEAPTEATHDDLDLIQQPGHPVGSFESPSKVSDSQAIPEMTARTAGPRRPTWNDLTSQSARKRAETYPPSRRLDKPKPEKPAGRGLLASLRGGAEKTQTPKSPEVVRASCSFDKGENRLVDFTLPDLQGRPVRFQDIDADYVLIDFWGTWCGPCLRSIPHLVQLQNRYDPRRLRVIGVAYERSEPAENSRLVQDVMQQLGMNYPVLMGESDGEPCPLQSAFHVQAYPTMVLVDRHGRILWRESGSNPTTMTRLDRVIASNTRASENVLRR